jgi:hypothetical protein
MAEHIVPHPDTGEAVAHLRDLTLLHAAGVLDDAAYRTACLRLDRATGLPCNRCGQRPAQLKRDRLVYCGRCFLETT